MIYRDRTKAEEAKATDTAALQLQMDAAIAELGDDAKYVTSKSWGFQLTYKRSGLSYRYQWGVKLRASTRSHYGSTELAPLAGTGKLNPSRLVELLQIVVAKAKREEREEVARRMNQLIFETLPEDAKEYVSITDTPNHFRVHGSHSQGMRNVLKVDYVVHATAVPGMVDLVRDSIENLKRILAEAEEDRKAMEEERDE